MGSFKKHPGYFFSYLNTNIINPSIIHIRPRFELSVSGTPAEVLQRISDMLEKAPSTLSGNIVDNHVILDIIEEEVHYWSPQLHFRVEADEEQAGKSILLGLIGPRPAVWTMFVFIYLIIGLIGFGISSYGISKWMLGEATFYLWGFPISLLFMLSAYKAGKYGEQLGKDQVEVLKQFVREVVASKQV